MIPRPTRFDATLLFRADTMADDRPDLLAMAERLNMMLIPDALSFEIDAHRAHKTVKLSHPDFLVTLDRIDAPFETGHFADQLGAPMTRLNGDGLADAVAAHSGRFAASVAWRGAADTAMDDGALFGAMKVLRAVVHQMLLHGTFDLVHWGQSDQLFSPARFLETSRRGFPSALFIRPVPFASGARADGRRRIGFVAEGAELFIGKPVIFAEDHHGLRGNIAATHTFIEYCFRRGQIIADGESFGHHENERISVRHLAPGARYPDGAVELAREDLRDPALSPVRVVSDLRHGAAPALPGRPGATRPEEWDDLTPNLPPGSIASAWQQATSTTRKTLPTAMVYGLNLVLILIIPMVGFAVLVYNLIRGPNMALTRGAVVAATALNLFAIANGGGLGGWADQMNTFAIDIARANISSN